MHIERNKLLFLSNRIASVWNIIQYLFLILLVRMEYRVEYILKFLCVFFFSAFFGEL